MGSAGGWRGFGRAGRGRWRGGGRWRRGRKKVGRRGSGAKEIVRTEERGGFGGWVCPFFVCVRVGWARWGEEEGVGRIRKC